MNVAVTRSEAEQELVHQFAKVAPDLPGGEPMAACRRAAMRRFESTGLPHRRIEEWKYTDLRSALRSAYPPAKPGHASVSRGDLDAALGPIAGLVARRLVFIDGYYASALSDLGGGSEHGNLRASPLSEAFADRLPRRSNLAEPNPVLALNDAFAVDGALVEVDAADRARPLLIVVAHTAKSPARVTTRNVFRIGAGASATIIEVHCRLGDAPLQASASTTVEVGEGSNVDHIKVNLCGSEAVHLGHWDIEIGQESVYRGFQLTASGRLVRNDITLGFTGPDARVDLSGLMLGRGNDHIDTTLLVNHTTTGCEGRELFKTVLDDRARAVFQGKVIVAPEAQKTDGKQMAQALMLSEDTEFDSKPELEIYADDVACGHGSTAAELDADMLFYLRSRGISLAEARRMLIESFATDALEKIEVEAVRDVGRAIVVQWLGAATR
jgi:Fe-S cluster assembly protein SufD